MRLPVRPLGISAMIFGACLMGGLGSPYLLNPAGIHDALGIAPETPSALAEIRSTYGGLHVGIALFLIACAASERTRRAGLLFCGLAFVCAGAARFAGVLEFRPTESVPVVVASLEVAFGMIALWLYRAWPAA